MVFIFMWLNICFNFVIKITARETEREMTVKVGPGLEECFYENIKSGEILDLEYQVIDGGQGELDINLHIANQYGTILIQDFKKSEGTHRTTLTEKGDYRICWDNTFSRFNAKTIFFAILIDNDEADDLWDDGFDATLRAEDVYEMRVEDIKVLLLRSLFDDKSKLHSIWKHGRSSY